MSYIFFIFLAIAAIVSGSIMAREFHKSILEVAVPFIRREDLYGSADIKNLDKYFWTDANGHKWKQRNIDTPFGMFIRQHIFLHANERRAVRTLKEVSAFEALRHTPPSYNAEGEQIAVLTPPKVLLEALRRRQELEEYLPKKYACVDDLAKEQLAQIKAKHSLRTQNDEIIAKILTTAPSDADVHSIKNEILKPAAVSSNPPIVPQTLSVEEQKALANSLGLNYDALTNEDKLMTDLEDEGFKREGYTHQVVKKRRREFGTAITK